MSREALFLELLKLVMQLVGALIVARLAVTWALRRYKSEKIWERRLAAYTDLLAAMTEMRILAGQWFDEAIERREIPEKLQGSRQDRFQAARRKVEETSATAEILLGPRTGEVLQKLLSDLEDARNTNTLEEHLDSQGFALRKAIDALLIEGRALLA